VILVGLSGAMGAGKSTVATLLAQRLNAHKVTVRTALLEVLGLHEPDRATLQREGASLDERTGGTWLLQHLEDLEAVGHQAIVVDSFRTRRQTLPVLTRFPRAHLIHLHADEATRRRRYQQAAAVDHLKAGSPFDVVSAHPVETEVEHLAQDACLVIDTGAMTPQDVVDTIADHFRLDA